MQVAKPPPRQGAQRYGSRFSASLRAINAAGRMDIASEVVELFLTRDPQRAEELARKLDTLERRSAARRRLGRRSKPSEPNC